MVVFKNDSFSVMGSNLWPKFTYFDKKSSISTNRFKMSHFRSLNVTRRSPVIDKDYSHSNRINSISFAPLYLNFILSKNYKRMLSKPYKVYFIPNVN